MALAVVTLFQAATWGDNARRPRHSPALLVDTCAPLMIPLKTSLVCFRHVLRELGVGVDLLDIIVVFESVD